MTFFVRLGGEGQGSVLRGKAGEASLGSVRCKKNRDWSRWETNGVERQEGKCEWKQDKNNAFLCTIQEFMYLI